MRDARLDQLIAMSIPRAVKRLERLPDDADRRRLAGTLGFHWMVRDINLAWKCVSRSALDAATKQVLYTTLGS
jgi:hypothetical protein